MTNAIPYFEEAVRWSESLMNAPAALLVLLVCISVGYVLKAISVFPNRFIPLAVMVIGAVFLMLLTFVKNAEIPAMTRNFCVGFVLGFAAWVIHRVALKRLEEKFGWFKLDETEFVEKPKQEKEKQP